jgi:hypothetical protein
MNESIHFVSTPPTAKKLWQRFAILFRLFSHQDEQLNAPAFTTDKANHQPAFQA